MADKLNIVLLGAPSSGKSSLLGALVVAGESQSAQLGGKVVDVGGSLTEIKDQVYQKGPAPTREEVCQHAFTLDASAPGQGPAASAVVTDCSGAAAQAILTSQTSFPPTSALARALLDADVLLLLVDASASVEQQVAAIGDFLTLLQQVRGERADIGGLPVYLVLSKCDLIARPGDSYNQWLQRIEEAKRKLDERFQELLAME